MKPSAIREILKVTAAPDVISFAGGLPAPELFPVEAVARSAQAVLLSADGPASLQYGVTEGHLPLRQWVAAHLAETVSLSVTPDDIVITHGSQQALDLIAKVLLDPGDLVVTENPAYLGALQVFQAYEAHAVGLASDAHGLQPTALRAFLESSPVRPKLLYLIPNYQNPTGVSLTAARRAEIVRIAAHFGVPVLEDDPYGALRFSGEAQPALGTFPGARDCLYLGTSSKILAPGLRVAWLAVTDAGLREKITSAKQAADLQTSSFTQRLVHHYVSQPGALSAHVETLRSVYARRRDLMLAALERELPAGCTWTKPDGGLFLWVTLPASIDTTALLQIAAREKIAFVPGAPFWVGEPVRNTLRLNFSNSTEERIETGMARLGAVIRAAL
ncbi:PLP-dependent aminotransferase family protein [Rariglobus hedericola]|uniref:PLP-dependent aminotransferase family protein n=2 Tax=Rariglobus hedericola TaxID=2597822 RepID=A0A556QSZ2_9BACT|nr:PLP-dependent aminotransferase family protein [Rariglobus hedericola]